MTWQDRAGLTHTVKREIMDAAEKWWEATGRQLVPKEINERQDPPSVRTTTGPIFITKPTAEPDIGSGILRALPWEELKGEEQARIMYQYFVGIWLPDHPEIRMEQRLN